MQITGFQEDAMQAKFNTADVVMIKTPASCSAICQPSDVSPFFRAAKEKLKKLRIDDCRDLGLKSRILAALASSGLSRPQRQMTAEALQLIVVTIQETMKKVSIMK
jgi:hypothetical protein